MNCGVEISMKCSHEPHEKLVSKQQSGGLYMYIINIQLQKQVIDKCKKKQFLKLEHKDVDFLKSIFLSEGTN